MNTKMVIILLVLFISASDFDIAKGENKKSKLEQMIELQQLRQKHIDFYAKVIDQTAQPVTDAQVFLSINKFGGAKEFTLKTDSRGDFEIKNETGSLVYIYLIKKQGYEYIRGKDGGFDYGAPLEKDRFKPDKNNPVIFHMRKKERPTLVIPGEFKKALGAEGIEYEVDLVRDITLHERGYLGKFDKGEHVDLLIKATASKNRSNYTVSFTTPDKDSGIVVSDEMSYTTPESGYKPNQTIELPASANIKKYVYVKGRAGGLYSRLDLKLSSGQKGVYIEVKSWTNPRGLRNVDYDPDIYIENVRRENEEQKKRNIEREERNTKILEERKKK